MRGPRCCLRQPHRPCRQQTHPLPSARARQLPAAAARAARERACMRAAATQCSAPPPHPAPTHLHHVDGVVHRDGLHHLHQHLDHVLAAVVVVVVKHHLVDGRLLAHRLGAAAGGGRRAGGSARARRRRRTRAAAARAGRWLLAAWAGARRRGGRRRRRRAPRGAPLLLAGQGHGLVHDAAPASGGACQGRGSSPRGRCAGADNVQAWRPGPAATAPLPARRPWIAAACRRGAGGWARRGRTHLLGPRLGGTAAVWAQRAPARAARAAQVGPASRRGRAGERSHPLCG
jgi:hypothetical protein